MLSLSWSVCVEGEKTLPQITPNFLISVNKIPIYIIITCVSLVSYEYSLVIASERIIIIIIIIKIIIIIIIIIIIQLYYKNIDCYY